MYFIWKQMNKRVASLVIACIVGLSGADAQSTDDSTNVKSAYTLSLNLTLTLNTRSYRLWPSFVTPISIHKLQYNMKTNQLMNLHGYKQRWWARYIYQTLDFNSGWYAVWWWAIGRVGNGQGMRYGEIGRKFAPWALFGSIGILRDLSFDSTIRKSHKKHP
jgi:hypothetical protein